MFFDPDFLGLLRPGYDFLFYFVKFYGFFIERSEIPHLGRDADFFDYL